MYQNLPAASLPMRYLGLANAQRMTEAPPWQRYPLALVFFAVALAARFELVDVLPDKGFPFLTFFPAVLLATYLAGLGPGLLASGLSFLAAWLFFIQPDRSVSLTGADMVALAFFSTILLIDCLVIHFMKSALTRVNRTERQLRESSQRLRLVLDNLYVYVGILSLDGTLQEVNEEALLAAEARRDEIVGRPLWEASWWASDARQQQHLRAAIERASTGETARFDVEVQPSRADADEIVCRATVTPIAGHPRSGGRGGPPARKPLPRILALPRPRRRPPIARRPPCSASEAGRSSTGWPPR